MTAPQAKRLSEERLFFLIRCAVRDGLELSEAIDLERAAEGKMPLNTNERIQDIMGKVRFELRDELAAAAQREEQVRVLVEACRQLLGDEDECYEPGKCLVTADAMKRIRAALNPTGLTGALAAQPKAPSPTPGEVRVQRLIKAAVGVVRNEIGGTRAANEATVLADYLDELSDAVAQFSPFVRKPAAPPAGEGV